MVMAVGESATEGPHGFTPTLTSFVGRDEAMREIAALLGEYRLVTVTGPGGAGKTRLAGEVARQVADRFADGVWLAELAPVRDPALVAGVVAAALGMRDLPGVSTAEALARLLARQQLLLVLDNCEHVIDAAASLCAGLLLACDDVRVLATSREPLRVPGEARYRLAPLALPGLEDPAEAAVGCEAVALFADRACRADARFALTSEIGPLVARLVARLDGMPLAIELAAARVEALGVTQLLDRIDDRFELLVAGDRLVAGRQRSLAATVQWSYQLLDEQERRVFRAVSVFPGPFTLEAAEAVAGIGAGPRVLRLVDCSLIGPPRAGPDGRWRYLMLETLRAYGARLLTGAGEQDEAAAALAGYALREAEQAAAGLQTRTGEVAAARWLDAEDATMRQVLTWAMHNDAATALRLAVALAPWWMLRGRLVSQRTLLREAAGPPLRAATGGAPRNTGSVLLRCTPPNWPGRWAVSPGSATPSGTGRRPGRWLTACAAGRRHCRIWAGPPRRPTMPAAPWLWLGSLATRQGRRWPWRHLAVAVYRAGDLDSAVQLSRQVEQTPADIPGWVARLHSDFLTIVLTEAGELAAAERVCAAGLARSREAGDPWNQARLLVRMATLDLRAARIPDAAAHLRESLQIAVRTGQQFELQNGLDCCGHMCAATGRYVEAVTVWAAHAAIFRHEGYAYPPAEARRQKESLRKAQQALGPDRARTAEERGTAMSRDTATEFALMLTAPRPPSPATAPSPAPLSARERELVTLVAQGRTNAQIAAQLYISVRTVTSHLDRIRDKTGCRRRADLTRLALTTGLV